MRAQLGGSKGTAALIVVLLVGVAAVAVAGAGSGAGDGQPSGEDILNDTRDRYANAESVVGNATVTLSNGTANATAAVEFAAAGNGSRVIVTRDNETYRAGSNGTVAWYVGPNRSAAWELDALRQRAVDAHNASNASNVSDPGALLNRTMRALENVSVERLRDGTDDGTPAHVLRLTNENENESGDTNATLWIAKNDSRVLKAVLTDGTNTTVVDYEDTRFNVSVHESTFDPPSDRLTVTTFERYDTFAAAQDNTSLDLPSLGSNATFREAGVLTRSDGTLVTQRYEADGGNVSVVSTTIEYEFNRSGANVTRVTVNGHPANVTTVRGAAVVYWESDGITTAVVTEAGEDRAVELARELDE